MGKGGGGPGAASALSEQMALNLMRSGGASRKQVFKQLTEGLKTGNIQARIPIIQSQVEQALGQGAQATKAATEQVYKSGDYRGPAGQEAIASTRALAQRAVAAVPTEVIGQSVLNAPETLQGAAQSAFGLMGTAGGIRGAAAQANAQADAQAASTAGSAAAAVGTIIAVAI